MPDRLVPVLRSGDPGATLDFWRALGFEVLHDQRRPYIYLSVRRGGVQVDFTGQAGPGLLLWACDDVDALHQTFRAGIKAAFGRVPRSGLPRLGAVSQQKQDRRFNMADPDGNHLIVLTPGRAAADDPGHTGLGRAVKAARLSAYGEENLEWAAAHLDDALRAAAGESPRARLAAWVLRADMAALMGDAFALAGALRAARAAAAELDAAARRDAAADLRTLDHLAEESAAQDAPAEDRNRT